MVFVLCLALAQVTSGTWSSGRPAECGDSGGRGSNVWERAKSPQLRQYCDLVAGASSKLAGTTAMAHVALESARQAEAVLPGHAAPLILEGRALLALGQLDEALTALEKARARDPHGLDDPLAVLAWGRALARSNRTAEAAEAYRTLLPRTSALSSVERAAAEVEAGFVTMSLGPTGLDEATAAFREAMREGEDETHGLAVLALAMALDRRGDVAEARALLSERMHGDPRSLVASARAREVLAVARAESDCIVAIALEERDPQGARAAWQRCLDAQPTDATGATGPWVAHARAHLRGLAGKVARHGPQAEWSRRRP